MCIRDSCKILRSKAGEGVASVLFLVWDERSVYHLMGGTMPGFNGLETYNALTWNGITLAHDKGPVSYTHLDYGIASPC